MDGVSLRAFLPLLLVALGTGYLLGLVATLRTVDRTEAREPGDAQAARAWFERMRADAARDASPEQQAAERAAFLERWPDSWLAAHWERR